MKHYFCPRCHKRVIPPQWIHQANIQGTIKLACGDKTCKGTIKIKKKNDNQQQEEEASKEEIPGDSN